MLRAPGIHCLPDGEALLCATAELFIQEARASLEVRGHCRIALAGGSTPRGLYTCLAEHHAEDLSWERLDFFWGDERPVGPEDPDSNFRMARESLLSRLPVDPARIHRLEGERSDAAEHYEAELRRVFAPEAQPRFDLVLLGMGPDGHTASLFPGCSALEETRRWVVATEVPGKGRRLTLTYPVLNAARAVVFLVAGAEKREALRSVLGGSAGESLPAARVRPERLWWMLDRESAALLG
nr:6-phosphogluconolactonase [uncultured Holophaga sp.]